MLAVQRRRGYRGVVVVGRYSGAMRHLRAYVARIGDAADGYANGIVTHVNALAAAMGVQVGDCVRDVIAAWQTDDPTQNSKETPCP